jgi:hypothetical protein
MKFDSDPDGLIVTDLGSNAGPDELKLLRAEDPI